jgi:hypothetical protein
MGLFLRQVPAPVACLIGRHAVGLAAFVPGQSVAERVRGLRAAFAQRFDEVPKVVIAYPVPPESAGAAGQQARERARLSAIEAALGAKADTVPVPAREPALLLDVDSGLIFPLDGAPDSR